MYTIDKLTVKNSQEALLIAVVFFNRTGWTVALAKFCKLYSIDYLQVAGLAELINEIPGL